MPVCPKCGCPRSRKEKEDPAAFVVSTPRVCTDCGHRYMAPLPRWVGGLAYVFAAGVLAAVTAEALTPPTELPIQLTWPGRVGMVCLAGVLAMLGTKVIRGEVGDEATLPEQGRAFRDRNPWARRLDLVLAVVAAAVVLVWLLR